LGADVANIVSVHESAGGMIDRQQEPARPCAIVADNPPVLRLQPFRELAVCAGVAILPILYPGRHGGVIGKLLERGAIPSTVFSCPTINRLSPCGPVSGMAVTNPFFSQGWPWKSRPGTSWSIGPKAVGTDSTRTARSNQLRTGF